MPVPIAFMSPDSEGAREALAQAVQAIPRGVPIVGLVLKVYQTPEGEEKLVNYEFADPDFLRSLALILQPEETDPYQPSKES